MPVKKVKSLKGQPKNWDKKPCPYCGGQVVYGSNAELYGREYGNGRCYFCKECGASVGVFNNSKHKPTRKPLGLLSTWEMKALMQECRANFDSVWQSRQYTRRGCYQRLAKLMGIEWGHCHFSYFNEADLKRALKIVKTPNWWMDGYQTKEAE